VKNMKGKTVVALSTIADEADLKELLAEHDLAMLGNMSDYVLLKIDGRLCAMGRLVLSGKNCFHLEVFGVKNELRGKGIGSYLLSEIIKKPWEYCSETKGNGYCKPSRLTTVARGNAASFYEKHGFRAFSFDALPPPYNTQCDGCPDWEACQPLPMVLEKGW
jgi:N-acetylglutamate synthase-like GNAT family acetyltransferase